MSSIMSVVSQRSEQQTQKLEGVEKLVLSIQQVISVIGETVKNSKIMEVMFKKPAARRNKVISTPVPKCKESKSKQATSTKKADKVSQAAETACSSHKRAASAHLSHY